MTELHIDFETRSRANLLKVGAYRYAADPSTDILCCAWAFDEGEVQVADDVPDEVFEHLESGGLVWAHNANFERQILANVWAFEVPLEQWRCSAVAARANNLPGRLDHIPRALGIDYRKDPRGKFLIEALSMPHDWRKTRQAIRWNEGVFNNDPTLLDEMRDYCRQDVVVEREILRYCRALTDQEWAEYAAQEAANDRGIRIDRTLCEYAAKYAYAETGARNAEIERITGSKAKGTKTTQWVYDRLPDELKIFMEVDNERISLDRARSEEILTYPLDADVKRVIEGRMGISKASTAKFNTMLARASLDDDRVRGSYIFNGAGATGRASAQGLQLHNFPRDCADDVDGLVDRMAVGEPLDDPLTTLASLLRPSLIAADGHTLVWGDWSSIEGRVLHWLTGDPRANARLRQYADGVDIYVQTAAGFAGTRQEGKVAELSLGFGGGIGAFQAMAAGYGVHIADEAADRIKYNWRDNNAWVVKWWGDLHKAAAHAWRDPGCWYAAGRISYLYEADPRILWCRLPNGRLLAYRDFDGEWDDQWNQFNFSALKGNWTPKVGDPWPRVKLWPGLMAENVTQATAACLLREAMVDLDELIGTTHDELICEVPDEDVEAFSEELQEWMEYVPEWANGLPLAAEVQSGKRYSK